MELRFDRDGALARPRTTAAGTLYDGRVARTGAHSYPHGTEHRDASELTRIVGQLAGTPIVLGHPRDGRKVRGNPNAGVLIVGRVQSARLDGDHAAAELLVHRHDAIDAIAAGTVELSLGYTVRVDERGYHHDTEIDHLAIVPVARCGSSCSIRVDCASGCSCGDRAAKIKRIAKRYGEDVARAASGRSDSYVDAFIAQMDAPAPRPIDTDDTARRAMLARHATLSTVPRKNP